jgi:pantothenate kinase type III
MKTVSVAAMGLVREVVVRHGTCLTKTANEEWSTAAGGIVPGMTLLANALGLE